MKRILAASAQHTIIPKAAMAFACALGLAGCGGSGNSNGTLPGIGVNNDIPVTIGVSDSAVESLQSVVLQIDEITFETANGGTQSFQDFYDVNTGEHSLDTISVDLLQYQGANVFNIIRSQDLDPATYTQITISIRNTSASDNYVITENGAQLPLEISNDTLQIPGFTLSDSDANSEWVIEFDLRASLTFESAPEARYVMSDRGIRFENQNTSGIIFGDVSISTLNTMANCGDPNTGNIVYLYPAASFNLDLTDTEATSSFVIPTDQRDAILPYLADQFDPQVATDVPDGLIAPTTSAAVTSQGEYVLPFLPLGAYILAYSCTADADAADTYDEITLTDFPDQLLHIYLTEGEQEQQDLPRL